MKVFLLIFIALFGQVQLIAQIQSNDPEFTIGYGDLYHGNNKERIRANGVSKCSAYAYSYKYDRLDIPTVFDSVLIAYSIFDTLGHVTKYVEYPSRPACKRRELKKRPRFESMDSTVINCYYNERNLLDSLRRIEYEQSGSMDVRFIAFVYDSIGRVLSQISETTIRLHQYDFVYSEDTVLFVKWREISEGTSNAETVFDTLHYNIPFAEITKFLGYDPATIELDSLGRLISYRKLKFFHGLGVAGYFRDPDAPVIELFYDQFNNVITQVVRAPDGMLEDRFNRTYNSKGLHVGAKGDYQRFTYQYEHSSTSRK